jgi:hypothetical protein
MRVIFLLQPKRQKVRSKGTQVGASYPTKILLAFRSGGIGQVVCDITRSIVREKPGPLRDGDVVKA